MDDGGWRFQALSTLESGTLVRIHGCPGVQESKRGRVDRPYHAMPLILRPLEISQPDKTCTPFAALILLVFLSNPWLNEFAVPSDIACFPFLQFRKKAIIFALVKLAWDIPCTVCNAITFFQSQKSHTNDCARKRRNRRSRPWGKTVWI